MLEVVYRDVVDAEFVLRAVVNNKLDDMSREELISEIAKIKASGRAFNKGGSLSKPELLSVMNRIDEKALMVSTLFQEFSMEQVSLAMDLIKSEYSLMDSNTPFISPFYPLG